MNFNPFSLFSITIPTWPMDLLPAAVPENMMQSPGRASSIGMAVPKDP